MMDFDELQAVYTNRYKNFLVPLASKLEENITSITIKYPRIDRVCARAKSIDSFMQKAKKIKDDNYKYLNPIDEIQDQIGARIITYFISDLVPICKLVEEYLGPIEKQKKEPENDNEFGYEGYHYIILMPTDLVSKEEQDNYPRFFELQIRTLYQHAWAQADHDLAYKATENLTKEEKRKIAFTSAQSWGADKIFDDLFNSIHS
jgi:putative GTP pyrophosphokinase